MASQLRRMLSLPVGGRPDACSPEQKQHAIISSHFLGPKAENMDHLRAIVSEVLDSHGQARRSYFPEDGDFITPAMRDQPAYRSSVEALKQRIRGISEELERNSIPFWSPRYNAHMNGDTAMASVVGYIAALMYNPNNVTVEGSPYTTAVEHKVGKQLCSMLGFCTEPNARIEAWGHITCDGSVANLEAIWSSEEPAIPLMVAQALTSAARNLKYYPLSLRLAMGRNEPLHFLNHVEPPFVVRLCQASDDDDDVDDDESQPGHRNGWKPFKDLTTWELLNLRPTTILELPIRLTEEYSISPTSLQDALRKFSIQTVGKEYFERDDTFGLKGTGKFFVSSTKHYSWPKGGAITGLGSDNFLDVAVDQDARMNCKDLERKLQNCIDNRIPVFGVVAIIGSTEHGACDPLDKILQVRKRCEAKGLSFSVHCDAAWGGYFRTTLPPQVGGQSLPFVPSLGLREHTIRQLRSLAHADSVTIDPHKSGYINYPAGGLCYRDGRMRYLVTWTSPIVSHSKGESDTSMGLCGVEGSKPGAAAVAAWAAHESIGLNHLGYGRLLGEALFTSTKLYCHWATMTRDGEDLMVVPLNRLPSEIKGLGTRAIESDKNRIRGILSMSNKELHDDETRFRFFAELGGDLMINAFACNFRVDGRPCQDIEEINRLNRRIFQRLSVTKPAKLGNEKGNGAKKTPLWLTTSNFSHAKFGDCLVHFKKRLGLTHERSLNQGNLSFLVNVTMSPWPSDSLLLQEMADCFKTIAEEETKIRLYCNTVFPTVHEFLVQGRESQLFLVSLPRFHLESHRRQLVLRADIPDEVRRLYAEKRAKYPDQSFFISNDDREGNKTTLDQLLADPSGIVFRLDQGRPRKGAKPLATFSLNNIEAVVDESLGFESHEETYPDKMPFYLFGSAAEPHIAHVLKRGPNGQIDADCVALEVEPKLDDHHFANGNMVAVFDNIFERSMQPLPLQNGMIVLENDRGLKLVPSIRHKVSVYRCYDDFRTGTSAPLARGTIALTSKAFAEWEKLNEWADERQPDDETLEDEDWIMVT